MANKDLSSKDLAKANKLKNTQHTPLNGETHFVMQKTISTTTCTMSSTPCISRPSISSQVLEKLKILQIRNNIKILFSFSSHHGALEQETLQNKSSSNSWFDSNFARLPFNNSNTKLRVHKGESKPIKKWEIIQEELMKLTDHIKSSSNFGNAFRESVKNYNSKAAANSFDLLNKEKVKQQLKQIFPVITKEAGNMPNLFPKGIPILRKHSEATLFMNQRQICCILSNAFLCAFPNRNQDLSQEMPSINFNTLFDGFDGNDAHIKTEKLNCILHYFKRISHIPEQGTGSIISFERRHLTKTPNWNHSQAKLSWVFEKAEGNIEESKDCLQVDFANKFVGGGVLGRGMVMEEIRFAICPELIACRLFTEKLEKDEVLIVVGVEQFSKYEGYASSFKFIGNFDDKTPIDEYGRRNTRILVMDAFNFESDWKKQFQPYYLDRELNKCYCGFEARFESEKKSSIATGNWGCGVFNGDVQLKFILQWMAASHAGRSLNYYTGDKKQAQDIVKMVKHLCGKNVNVSSIYKALDRYNRKEVEYNRKQKTLFQYLEHEHKWY